MNICTYFKTHKHTQIYDYYTYIHWGPIEIYPLEENGPIALVFILWVRPFGFTSYITLLQLWKWNPLLLPGFWSNSTHGSNIVNIGWVWRMGWRGGDKPDDKSEDWTDSISSISLAFSYLTSLSIDAFFWKTDSVKS